jgi:DNA helicase-2/ATP-dependent DNA helicase PcrA
MVSKVDPLNVALECIAARQNFLLQGGAGSGKTESLSRLVRATLSTEPSVKIACITHTNKAAAEIRARIGESYYVGTIHSFLNQAFGKYKKNIHKHIWRLFKVEQMFRLPESSYPDEKTRNLEEHRRFKATYEKYTSAYFTVTNTRPGKVVGKRNYDADPVSFNTALNLSIEDLNKDIKNIISLKDHRSITYNESGFDNFDKLTYGHDGLLELASILFEEYPLLGKIITDKFDCIFVDEFQDTEPKIVTALLKLPKGSTAVGFFGDSMQSIYSQGVGNVEKFISDGTLLKVEKEDNYRCSKQVIDFINTLRYDGLSQELAYKEIDGVTEKEIDRQGEVLLYIAEYQNKPNVRSSVEEKRNYEKALNYLIDKAKFDSIESKTLLLSNKAIASKGGFAKLYDIFSERYREPNTEIERVLTKLQFFEVFELCEAFRRRDFNLILTKLKSSGIVITKISDKENISDAIKKISKYEGNVIDAIYNAIEIGLLTASDSFIEYVDRIKSRVKEFENNAELQKFESDYINDGHTYIKMSKKISGIDEEYFDEQKRALVHRNFYRSLMSKDFAFNEAFEYCRYQDEQTPYVTMHKTKGTGIANVIVVLDEYFWNEYDFKSIFDPAELDEDKKKKNQRLVYVACSRAKKNLRCVRLVSADEKSIFTNAFANTTIIEIELPLTYK